MNNDELRHYGVKGMKWGVRKDKTVYGRKEDSVIPKGTQLGRVSLTKEDPTYDNKKYVSYTPKDHKKWEKYLGKTYSTRGRDTYNIMYETTKDIKVVSGAQSGKRFVDEFLMSEKSSQAISDTEKALTMMKMYPSSVYDIKNGEVIGLKPAHMASLNMAAQTETGKQFVQNMLNDGYGAVADVHGRNTAYDPLIILGPDDKLKKASVSKTKYTK